MNTKPVATSNRRCASRFPVVWNVLLEQGLSGQTRDVSVSGVYFETDGALPTQEVIRFVLASSTPTNSADLWCEGRVVRVEQRDAVVGIGVTLEWFRFGCKSFSELEASTTLH